MWILASILAIGILSAIAWRERLQLETALRDELDVFLEELLA